MVNWNEHTKRTLHLNCSNTRQDKGASACKERKRVLIIGKARRRAGAY